MGTTSKGISLPLLSSGLTPAANCIIRGRNTLDPVPPTRNRNKRIILFWNRSMSTIRRPPTN